MLNYLKIYFACSVLNSTPKFAKNIVEILKKYGEVINSEIVRDDIRILDEEYYKKGINIYENDIINIDKANALVAEVSIPSTGLGMEIQYALDKNKKVLCLYESAKEKNVSKMILTCKEMDKEKYSNVGDLEKIIDNFFKKEYPFLF